MSILWCGGEQIDFPNGAAVANRYQTAYFRSDYARCCMALEDGTFARSPNFSGGAITSGWLSFHHHVGLNRYYDILFAGFCADEDTNSGIMVGTPQDTDPGKITLYLLNNDGSKTVLATETGSTLVADLNCKIDIHVQNYGVSSTIDVYVDGTLRITYTGDCTVTGVTSLSAVIISGRGDTYYQSSEVIVADEDTRLFSLKTLVPNAAGDSSEWDNDYTSIDELEVSDADTVYTETADESFQCNLTGMPTGDFIVKAVKQVARMTDGVGGMGVQMGIKTNSTDNLESTITLGSVWDSYENLYNENPVTSNRFTPEEIDALQLSFKSVAV